MNSSAGLVREFQDLLAKSRHTLAALLFFVTGINAAIDPAHPYAYGANIGWMNARGDGTNGVELGRSYCSGYLWSANCGWISFGHGPTNGWRYNNATADDWGVNHDGQGKLSGYAYGANIGWIQFEQIHGKPRINLLNGGLNGYAWGANVGWISLSNEHAFLRATYLAPGPDSDGDGIPDAWEFMRAGDLNRLGGAANAPSRGAQGIGVLSISDADGDGASDLDEYIADTDPLDETSYLAISGIALLPNTNRITWAVEPTRFYRMAAAADLTNGTGWADVGLGLMTPDPGATMTRDVLRSAETSRYYRAMAIVPLTP